jgi:hypothetical protein
MTYDDFPGLQIDVSAYRQAVHIADFDHFDNSEGRIGVEW